MASPSYAEVARTLTPPCEGRCTDAEPCAPCTQRQATARALREANRAGQERMRDRIAAVFSRRASYEDIAAALRALSIEEPES